MTTNPAALSVDDPAPDFAATAVGGKYGTGKLVSLEDLRGSPVVLYFYPKDDTPVHCSGLDCGMPGASSTVGRRFLASASTRRQVTKIIAKFHSSAFRSGKEDRERLRRRVRKACMGRSMGAERRPSLSTARAGRAILRKVKPVEHVEQCAPRCCSVRCLSGLIRAIPGALGRSRYKERVCPPPMINAARNELPPFNLPAARTGFGHGLVSDADLRHSEIGRLKSSLWAR